METLLSKKKRRVSSSSSHMFLRKDSQWEEGLEEVSQLYEQIFESIFLKRKISAQYPFGLLHLANENEKMAHLPNYESENMAQVFAPAPIN